MEKGLKNKQVKQLFEAILELKSTSECEMFFRDLCTLPEILTLSERWQVAAQIDNNIPYRKICEKTGVSTATITRVAHWLHHGEGGYRLVLDRMKM